MVGIHIRVWIQVHREIVLKRIVNVLNVRGEVEESIVENVEIGARAPQTLNEEENWDGQHIELGTPYVGDDNISASHLSGPAFVLMALNLTTEIKPRNLP